jgi:outer membrane biosynthesis protein TonB
MNGVLRFSLVLVCGSELLLSRYVMAEEVNSSTTQPAIKTPVRIDKSHPPIVRAAEYPKESARLGEKGYCAVKVEVDFDGLIRSKQLVVSTGFGRLDVSGNHAASFSRA